MVSDQCKGTVPRSSHETHVNRVNQDGFQDSPWITIVGVKHLSWSLHFSKRFPVCRPLPLSTMGLDLGRLGFKARSKWCDSPEKPHRTEALDPPVVYKHRPIPPTTHTSGSGGLQGPTVRLTRLVDPEDIQSRP